MLSHIARPANLAMSSRYIGSLDSRDPCTFELSRVWSAVRTMYKISMIYLASLEYWLEGRVYTN